MRAALPNKALQRTANASSQSPLVLSGLHSGARLRHMAVAATERLVRWTERARP